MRGRGCGCGWEDDEANTMHAQSCINDTKGSRSHTFHLKLVQHNICIHIHVGFLFKRAKERLGMAFD